MKFFRIFGQLLIALSLVLALPARAADEPFEINAILSLSGPGAFLGKGEAAMLSAAERWVNSRAGGNGIKGRPVHFVIQDDQSNSATAVQLANQLAAKKVAAFLGPSLAATSSALQAFVTPAGPVMYSLVNSIHPPNGSYAFTAYPSSSDFTATLFRYLKAKGVKKLALITANDAGGRDGETSALDNLKLPEFRDMQLVANEHFNIGDLTVDAQMARIKAAGAEGLDAWTAGTTFGTVLHTVNESGWDGIVVTHGGNINNAQLASYATFLPRQLVLVGGPMFAVGQIPARIKAARTTFLDVMHQAGIAEPDQTNALAWDPMLMFLGGFRQIGTTATASQLRDYILQLHDFAGVNGFYDFRRGDQRGLDPNASVNVRWDKATNTFVTISKPGGLPL